MPIRWRLKWQAADDDVSGIAPADLSKMQPTPDETSAASRAREGRGWFITGPLIAWINKMFIQQSFLCDALQEHADVTPEEYESLKNALAKAIAERDQANEKVRHLMELADEDGVVESELQKLVATLQEKLKTQARDFKAMLRKEMEDEESK